MEVINLNDKLARLQDLWSPKVIADLNDSHVKLAKVKRELVWGAWRTRGE